MPSLPPTPEPPRSWAIRGTVPAARVSLQYRLAMALVAMAMVLLPLVYLGIIWVVGRWLYFYAQHGPVHTRTNHFWELVFYVMPLALGAIVILFMIKPLFQRRTKSVQPRALRVEDEPRLFEFIHGVCDLVKAPRPRRVLLDLDVNASARLTHGVWSIFTRNLTLVIGLPVAGGLTVQQLGGVLAHEFGHFAQGAGMSTTYLVRSVSMWFARVVYERDQWDATLESWARESDWRLMIVLQVARFTIWVVRRILWVLMMIGQFFSSVLMRQMEFDADHYEIQTSGSEAFIATAKRLRILGVGAHVTHLKQDESFVAKRVVDDLPGWVLYETAHLSKETCDEVLAAMADQKTGWLDSHPSDPQRITRAVNAHRPGVLTGDEPASALFKDFPALSREITNLLYREVLQLLEKEFAVESLSKMTAESDTTQRGNVAMAELFHGLLTPRTMVFIGPEDLAGGLSQVTVLEPAQPSATELAVARELNGAVERQRELRGVLSLFDASIPVDRAAYKLPGNSAGDAHAEERQAEARIQAAVTGARAVLENERQRLIRALRWLLAQPTTPSELTSEVQLLATTMERIQAVAPTVGKMGSLVIEMGAILENYERSSAKETAFRAINSRSDQLENHNEKVLTDLRDALFPFEHAKGRARIGAYLVDGIAHPETVVRTYLRGDAILGRLDGIYSRALGRLAAIGLDAERAAVAVAGSEAASE